MRSLAAALLILTAATESAAEGDFSSTIIPLLESRCASCHLMGSEPGNLALHGAAAHASLVGRQATGADMLLVRPAEPEASYLLHKLRGTHLKVGGSGARMPFGAASLIESDIKKIETWIANGAGSD
ncbi:MAG: hypothetical protein ABR612_05675 [Chromatocurvus sp.]